MVTNSKTKTNAKVREYFRKQIWELCYGGFQLSACVFVCV